MNQPLTTMPKPKVAKWLWITLIIVAVIGAGFFAWYYLMGPGKKIETKTSTTTPSTTTTPTTTTTTAPSTTTNTATADWQIFDEEGYGFSFKYPKTWIISSKTNEPLAGNPSITQKQIKIKNDQGNEYQLDNPAKDLDFEDLELGNSKTITAGGNVSFVRRYGKETTDNARSLYYATAKDPNNTDDLSVTFYGFSQTLDESALTKLDNLLSTFKFK